MNYEVFISYSRKDSDVAKRICNAFDSAGISYFIDKQGISGGFEFPVVLAEAIIECKVVLFLASKNSYDSKFTNAELTFAFNEKPKNSVLPYIIDGSTMPPALRFVFSSINWRTIESHPIEPTLVDDILKLLGRTRGVATFAPAKTYNVGDYYNDGVREGVVFEVSADGRHGKIVSLKKSEWLRWSSDSAEQKRLIGADSETDGAYNMAKVKAIPGWKTKYPAFKWCADLGEGWYLPSKEELLTIYKYKDKLNPKLTDKLSGWYWSSTESDKQFSDSGYFCAWYVLMSNGNTNHNYKYIFNGYVRAVSAF
ncbi:MAG: TIR domain-containing protein [Alistipes sp.]|nr:TIR domain-containing protein [Alistipes sp.]